jgi:predicted ATP-binding protein involved in virulence
LAISRQGIGRNIIDKNGLGKTAVLQRVLQNFVNYFLMMEVESHKEWSA